MRKLDENKQHFRALFLKLILLWHRMTLSDTELT